MNNKPKYKVGDWVVIDFDSLPDKVRKITSIDKLPYNHNQYWTNEDTWFGDGTKTHLWTIADAKDGDLLAYDIYEEEAPLIIIFKAYEPSRWGDTVLSYCSLSAKSCDFHSFNLHHKPDGWHPVTEEQRQFFFSKLQEAGCVWDAEKKEVRCDGTLQVRVCQPEEESASVIESLEKEDESPQTLAEACEKGVDMSRPLTFDCRLTEFENAVGLEIFDPPFNEEHIRIIKKESEKLLSIARKSFTANGKKIGRKIEGSTMTIFGLSASKKEIIERIIDTWNGEDE